MLKKHLPEAKNSQSETAQRIIANTLISKDAQKKLVIIAHNVAKNKNAGPDDNFFYNSAMDLLKNENPLTAFFYYINPEVKVQNDSDLKGEKPERNKAKPIDYSDEAEEAARNEKDYSILANMRAQLQNFLGDMSVFGDINEATKSSTIKPLKDLQRPFSSLFIFLQGISQNYPFLKVESNKVDFNPDISFPDNSFTADKLLLEVLRFFKILIKNQFVEKKDIMNLLFGESQFDVISNQQTHPIYKTHFSIDTLVALTNITDKKFHFRSSNTSYSFERLVSCVQCLPNCIRPQNFFFTFGIAGLIVNPPSLKNMPGSEEKNDLPIPILESSEILNLTLPKWIKGLRGILPTKHYKKTEKWWALLYLKPIIKKLHPFYEPRTSVPKKPAHIHEWFKHFYSTFQQQKEYAGTKQPYHVLHASFLSPFNEAYFVSQLNEAYNEKTELKKTELIECLASHSKKISKTFSRLTHSEELDIDFSDSPQINITALLLSEYIQNRLNTASYYYKAFKKIDSIHGNRFREIFENLHTISCESSNNYNPDYSDRIKNQMMEDIQNELQKIRQRSSVSSKFKKSIHTTLLKATRCYRKNSYSELPTMSDYENEISASEFIASMLNMITVFGDSPDAMAFIDEAITAIEWLLPQTREEIYKSSVLFEMLLIQRGAGGISFGEIKPTPGTQTIESYIAKLFPIASLRVVPTYGISPHTCPAKDNYSRNLMRFLCEAPYDEEPK